MACSLEEIISSSKPIAVAVSLWSPVIITTWIPASLHFSTAFFTSGRIGSIIPTKPTKIKSSSEISSLEEVFL